MTTLYGLQESRREGRGGQTNIENLIKQLVQVEEVAVFGTIGWDPKYHYNVPYPKYITPVSMAEREMQVISRRIQDRKITCPRGGEK